jgi:hypothetical protein
MKICAVLPKQLKNNAVILQISPDIKCKLFYWAESNRSRHSDVNILMHQEHQIASSVKTLKVWPYNIL